MDLVMDLLIGRTDIETTVSQNTENNQRGSCPHRDVNRQLGPDAAAEKLHCYLLTRNTTTECLFLDAEI